MHRRRCHSLLCLVVSGHMMPVSATDDDDDDVHHIHSHMLEPACMHEGSTAASFNVRSFIPHTELRAHCTSKPTADRGLVQQQWLPKCNNERVQCKIMLNKWTVGKSLSHGLSSLFCCCWCRMQMMAVRHSPGMPTCAARLTQTTGHWISNNIKHSIDRRHHHRRCSSVNGGDADAFVHASEPTTMTTTLCRLLYVRAFANYDGWRWGTLTIIQQFSRPGCTPLLFLSWIIFTSNYWGKKKSSARTWARKRINALDWV